MIAIDLQSRIKRHKDHQRWLTIQMKEEQNDPMPRILAFAGSARTDSYNYRLVKVAAQGAQAAGADATIVDLRDYRLPLFDQDLEPIGKTKGRIAVEPEYWLKRLGSVSWWGFDRE